jgi:hypothetical protein
MCKKLIIAIKTLGRSGVSNTLKNHGIQNRVFHKLAKHLPEKNIMVFFNTMILSQNFKNILFSNTNFVDVSSLDI